MQLISLYIKKYNHLVDFTIAFNQNLSVIIGVNGSGKSSVLEVLALVFSDAYLGKKAALGFKLTYKLAKTTVELSSEDTGFEIQMNGKKIDNFLLPSNVVVYYSGLSDKMEKNSVKFMKKTKKRLLKQAAQTSVLSFIIVLKILKCFWRKALNAMI